MTIDIADGQIRDLVSQEFLATLKEVAKLYGWECDYGEITMFIGGLHAIKGLPFTPEQAYIVE